MKNWMTKEPGTFVKLVSLCISSMELGTRCYSLQTLLSQHGGKNPQTLPVRRV